MTETSSGTSVAAAIGRVASTEQCECVTDCASQASTACSLSGTPHIHPELGRCPAHPDAPGDWPSADLAAAGLIEQDGAP